MSEIFVGNTALLDITVRDAETAAVYDVSTASRMIFTMARISIDSSDYPSAFDWASDGASGIVHLDLTGFVFPQGSYGARLTLYNADYSAGVVAVDSLPVTVGVAISGSTPVDIDDLAAHEGLSAAHGSDGDVVGKTFLASVATGEGSAAVGHTSTAGATVKLALDVAMNKLSPVAEVVGRTETQTLTNKTLTTPTIADLTNMQHDHTSAANGGFAGLRAWARFDGKTGLTNPGDTVTVNSSWNCAVEYSAAGTYPISFTLALADANYCVVANGMDDQCESVMVDNLDENGFRLKTYNRSNSLTKFENVGFIVLR